MNSKPLTILIMAAACGSDVNVELRVSGGEDPPGGPSLVELRWAVTLDTDPLPSTTLMHRVEWDEDRSLLAIGHKYTWEPSSTSFVARYDVNDGALLGLVESATASFTDFDVAPDGRIVVAGNGNVAGEGEPCSNFVAWYEPDGTLVAVRPVETIDPEVVLALPDGRVAVAGRARLPDACSGAGDVGASIALLGPSGEVEWEQRLMSLGYAYRLELSASGGLLVGGNFNGVVEAGGLRADNGQKGFSPFVAELSPDGTGLWLTALTCLCTAEEMAVSASGHVFLTGPRFLEIDGVGADVFVAEIDTAGTIVGVREIEDGELVDSLDVSVQEDVLAIGGHVQSRAGIGGPMRGAFAVFFNPSGEVTDSVTMTPLEDEYSFSVAQTLALGPDGELAIAGFFNGEIDFGAGPVTGPGTTDDGNVGFVAVYRRPDLVEVD